ELRVGPNLSARGCRLTSCLPRFSYHGGRYLRLRASSSPCSVVLRIQPVAQAVARQVEGQRQREDGQPGPPRPPRRALEEFLGRVEHGAPARARRLNAQPEEGQDGLRDDRPRDGDGGL